MLPEKKLRLDEKFADKIFVLDALESTGTTIRSPLSGKCQFRASASIALCSLIYTFLPRGLAPMMIGNKIPDNLWHFYPPDEEETRGIDEVIFSTTEPAEDTSSLSPELSAAQKPSPFLPSRLTLESLENPFLNSQPAPTHWAVGWADLMMTMFILFLVMYLYPSAQAAHPLQSAQRHPVGEAQQSRSIGHSERGQDPAEILKHALVNADSNSEPVPSTDKLYDLTKLTREDEEFASFAKIDLNPEHTVRIILSADLLFPSGQADLHLIAKENIKKISELLKDTPHMINVVGHTDNQEIKGGTYATNWELSAMRATTVARFLIEEMGVPASRIMASGQSFYQPQVANDTPGNRARNRRVEIIVSLNPPPTLLLANSNILPKTVDLQ